MSLRVLTCRLQNRLGALDRLLGALTHRGLLTESLSTQVDAGTDSVLVTAQFVCDNDNEITKLLKSLEKQIYVLQVSASSTGSRGQLCEANASTYATIPIVSTSI